MDMRIDLFAPGMTALHKVGLAGLYMTLHALEEQKQTVEGLSWISDTKSLTLHWKENKERETFEKLIEKSFLVDKDGFITLTGLEGQAPLSIDQKYHLYYSLLHSFLQFGPHRPTGNKKTLVYIVDERPCYIKEFAPVKSFRHQKCTDDFFEKKSRQFRKSVEIAGWLYPGGAQRHVGFSRTKITEKLENALCLLFAPVGAIYYQVKSSLKGRKTRLAMLLPEVSNLEFYAELRQALSLQGSIECTASSASDAVLRMLILVEASRTRRAIARISGDNFSCRIIAFGITDWSEKQKSRTYTRTLLASNFPQLDNYRKADQIFANRWQKTSDEDSEQFYVSSSCARELIADNVANNRSWYENLSQYITRESLWNRLRYERKELHKMIEVATFAEERERLFIEICYESWRRRLGKLGSRAREEKSDFHRLAGKEAERLRFALTRSKNAETLRETVVDFWSRGGSNPKLRGGGLQELLPLFSEQNWKKTRDLALLALISYEPENAEEDKALSEIDLIGGYDDE